MYCHVFQEGLPDAQLQVVVVTGDLFEVHDHLLACHFPSFTHLLLSHLPMPSYLGVTTFLSQHFQRLNLELNYGGEAAIEIINEEEREGLTRDLLFKPP